MIKIVSVLTIILFFSSCNNEETNLEAFNPEAFAYDLGNSWEVNAMVNVKGFEQRKGNGETFETSISYSADIKTPEGKIIENLFSDKINNSAEEEFVDLPLEIQFELDSTYSLGKYDIIIHIKDNISGSVILQRTEFDLKE